MVKRDGEKADIRFWLSVGGLLFAIVGSFITLNTSVATNASEIRSLHREFSAFRQESGRRMERIEDAILEIRK